MILFQLRCFLLLLIVFSSCFGQDIVLVGMDGKIKSKYYLNKDGLITRAIFYDSDQKQQDTLLYTYSERGRIEKINLLGNGEVVGFDEELEKKHINDAVFQKSFLQEKGIKFPLPFINSSELGDMAKIFSINDKFSLEAKKGESIISFDSLYQKISFRSNIEKYIQHLTVIKKYKVMLRENLLIKEELAFEGGVLIRNYRYDKKNRLTSITWDCIYDEDSKKYLEVKQFTYN